MEVPISNLLSQAERLVTDRRKDSNSNKSDALRATGKDSLDLASTITAKFQAVQTKLGELQMALSREQAKIGILEEKNTDSSEKLQDILFEKEALFTETEVEMGQTNPSLLLQTAKLQLESLSQAIRQKEIESENLVSSGQIQDPNQVLSTLQKITGTPMKPFHEKTVLRLVQG